MIDKPLLISKIISQLEADLKVAELAAEQARNASIDEQSVAETQYDTLAIESAYLAEGQSRRTEEIKQAINQFKQMQQVKLLSSTKIKLGNVIKVIDDTDIEHNYFLAPAAGGLQFKFEQEYISVITPSSPIGKELMNKSIDDDYYVQIGEKIISGAIICLY